MGLLLAVFDPDGGHDYFTVIRFNCQMLRE